MNAATEQSRDVVIGNRRYIITSDDNDYLTHIGTEFEPHTSALLNTLFGPRSSVLDVGANIGCTSILFGARARRVISFEPSPTTFQFLRRNIEVAGLSNVELHNCALGSESRMSQLTFAASNRAGGFVSDKTTASAGHVTEAISIRRLDDIAGGLSLDALDLIKIDVEGFERSVLEGGRETLGRLMPVAALELNHWCLNAFQRISVPDFLDFLCSMFPVLVAVEGDKYLDLRDAGERYIVMYRHILHFQYMNLVGAFSSERLADFLAQYRHSA